MKQRSLESIIKEVLNDMNIDDDTYEAKIMMCHRKFNRLINRLCGDIDDMKDSSNKILFEENQVEVIKFILKQILSPNDNIIKNFPLQRIKMFRLMKWNNSSKMLLTSFVVMRNLATRNLATADLVARNLATKHLATRKQVTRNQEMRNPLIRMR
mgnify:FL=1